MSTSERPTAGRRFQRRARQEADKQALQTRILETARKQFATGTIETVSIQKIADALGYSKGTVLKYFPTKNLSLLAVKQQNLEEVTNRLRRVRARNPNSELRLRRVMEAYIDYWADNPDHYRSVFSMAGTSRTGVTPTGTISGIRKSPKAASGSSLFRSRNSWPNRVQRPRRCCRNDWQQRSCPRHTVLSHCRWEHRRLNGRASAPPGGS